MAGRRSANDSDDRDHHLRAVHRLVIWVMDVDPPAHSREGHPIALRGLTRGTPLVRDPDDRRTREQGPFADPAEDRTRIPVPPEERPIRQALVPTQEVVEIKNGKKVNVERKIYPGYVLVEMVMDAGDAAHHQRHPGRHQVRRARAAAAAAAPRGGQPPPRHRRRGGAGRGEGRDSVPGRSGGGDHRRSVHGFQRDGRGSDGGQGKGARVGHPVRTADERGAGLPAVEGLLKYGTEAAKWWAERARTVGAQGRTARCCIWPLRGAAASGEERTVGYHDDVNHTVGVETRAHSSWPARQND